MQQAPRASAPERGYLSAVRSGHRCARTRGRGLRCCTLLPGPGVQIAAPVPQNLRGLGRIIGWAVVRGRAMPAPGRCPGPEAPRGMGAASHATAPGIGLLCALLQGRHGTSRPLLNKACMRTDKRNRHGIDARSRKAVGAPRAFRESRRYRNSVQESVCVHRFTIASRARATRESWYSCDGDYWYE